MCTMNRHGMAACKEPDARIEVDNGVAMRTGTVSI